MLYTSRDYLQQRGTPETPQDAQSHLCIVIGAETWKRTEIWLMGGESNRLCSPDRLSARASSDAREGLGIAMLPPNVVVQPLFRAGLVEFIPERMGTAAHVLATTADRATSAKCRRLIAEVL